MKEDKTISLYFALEEVESLFTALHRLQVAELSKVEIRAVNVFRERLYYAIEQFAETEPQKEERQNRFFQLFHKYRNLMSKEEKTDRDETKQNEPQRIKV